MMAKFVFVTRELPCTPLDGDIHARVEIVVLGVTDEVLMALDIRANLDVISVWCALDGDGELLQSFEKPRQFSNLGLDVLGESFGQFHVFCADSDEHE